MFPIKLKKFKHSIKFSLKDGRVLIKGYGNKFFFPFKGNFISKNSLFIGDAMRANSLKTRLYNAFKSLKLGYYKEIRTEV
jgi:hypothetical protein